MVWHQTYISSSSYSSDYTYTVDMAYPSVARSVEDRNTYIVGMEEVKSHTELK